MCIRDRVDLDALNIGTSLTADYEQLMLSYPVLEQVINKLNLDMDSDTLAKMITLENPTDTRILNINVVSTDPKSARDIANTLMDVSVDYLPKTMSTNAPNVAQKAKLADHKDGPSYTKYTICLLYTSIIYSFFLLINSVSILRDLISRIISISPVFFHKFFNKFAELKQPEPPERIYPISVASEQGLDTNA